MAAGREITTRKGWARARLLTETFFPHGSWFVISDDQTKFTDDGWMHRWYSTGRPAGDEHMYAFLRTTGLHRRGIWHRRHVPGHAEGCKIQETAKIVVSAPYPVPMRAINSKTFSCYETGPMKKRLERHYTRWESSDDPPLEPGR